MIEEQTYQLLTMNDYLVLLSAIVFVVAMAVIIHEVIMFIPEFMKDWVKSIKNKSIQNFDDLLDTGKLTNEKDINILAEKWRDSDVTNSRRN